VVVVWDCGVYDDEVVVVLDIDFECDEMIWFDFLVVLS